MELDYPVYEGAFLPPEVTTDEKNVFKIQSLMSPVDDDSISITIDVDCSHPSTSLSESILEPLHTKALHKPSENPIVNDYDFEDIQQTSLDFLQVDSQPTADFTVGGKHGISVADVDWINHVLVTNHGDRQYIIDLYYTGHKKITDFGEIYSPLDDHIIGSIKFTD